MKTRNEIIRELKENGNRFDSADIRYCVSETGKIVYFALLVKGGFASGFALDLADGRGMRKLKDPEIGGEGFTHTVDACCYYNGNKREYFSGEKSL